MRKIRAEKLKAQLEERERLENEKGEKEKEMNQTFTQEIKEDKKINEATPETKSGLLTIDEFSATKPKRYSDRRKEERLKKEREKQEKLKKKVDGIIPEEKNDDTKNLEYKD